MQMHRVRQHDVDKLPTTKQSWLQCWLFLYAHLAIDLLRSAEVQGFCCANGADHLYRVCAVLHNAHMTACQRCCAQVHVHQLLLQRIMPSAKNLLPAECTVLIAERTLEADPMAAAMVSGCVTSYSTICTRRSAPLGSRPYATAVSRYACALSVLRTPTRTLQAHLSRF